MISGQATPTRFPRRRGDVLVHALPSVALLLCMSVNTTEVRLLPKAPVVRLRPAGHWTFDADSEGWTAEHQCELTTKEGHLLIRATGEDPFFHRSLDLPGGQMVLHFRARCHTGGPGRIYWVTDQAPNQTEDRAAQVNLSHDGPWREYTVRFVASGRLTELRIDPGQTAGRVEIDWIRLAKEERHPLSIEQAEIAGDVLRFTIKNHQPNPITFSAFDKDHTIEGHATLPLERALGGDSPLEAVCVALKYADWQPIRRTIFAYHPGAASRWIARPLGSHQLQVAKDGSVIRIRRDGILVGLIGPLVHIDGRLPALKLVEEEPQLRFEGDGVVLAVTTHDRELDIAIDSRKPCEGPVVRAIGSLEQGLLAGLEYLGSGERSSSKLDVETEEHLRFLPDPLKVSMPLMAFVTDRTSLAMTWSDMRLQPVYAAPYLTGTTIQHRMALRGSKIKATILVDQAPLEEAILWAVKRTGLPPLPPSPRTPEQQEEICLAALDGPLRNEAGWGHCVQKNWPRRPFAGVASTIWRLTGKMPELPTLVPGGVHVANDTAYFLSGRAEAWLAHKKAMVQHFLKQQHGDGSFRYDGKLRRGHFEDTASGVCARPAAVLLEYAQMTGDQAALDAGIRTLEYMKRFRTPRGAQVWEVPLHTPDLLAAAYLVESYVRGYELTGNKEYLDRARAWALSGVPFVYLWQCRPIMLYATPPVYGATFWRHSWLGLPVQWVGGVYAYYLTMLARHDNTLDWNHLARGILISAQQQQYPDGEKIGLLPDSFEIRYQGRRPADINPCALVSLQMVLDGKLDSLAVAHGGGHYVVAPFPVEIRQGKAHIRASSGLEYQIVIDGTRIRIVRSQGEDVVPLE